MSRVGCDARGPEAFNREGFTSLLARRFFFAPAFEIYGGTAGLYDFGPPGAALQSNVVAAWRQHFIIEDDMLELDAAALTPASLFEASGHLENFAARWVVKDIMTNEVLSADELVESVLQTRLKGDPSVKPIDNIVRSEYEAILKEVHRMAGSKLKDVITDYGIVNPKTGNTVTDPVQFNLMFGVAIGESAQAGFLRPEIAQGHFANFQRLYQYNDSRLPFTSACIGRSFHNEISPRGGILKCLEFTIAEVEHFVDPRVNTHPRFDDARDVLLPLLPQGKDDIKSITAGNAVAKGIILDEHLGFFAARVFLFLTKVGIDPARVRFRQLAAHERAHYSSETWAVEILLSSGWLLCAGCVDRGTYDLMRHEKATGVNFKTTDITFDEGVHEFIPRVIEAGFGFGRILFGILEHSYWTRQGDSQRSVISLRPLIAPTKVFVVPISSGPQFTPFVVDITAKLRRAGINVRVDDSSAAIGRRYARNDELGTPFGITVDFATLERGTVTLRERDSMEQIVGQIGQVISAAVALVNGSLDWPTACTQLPSRSELMV